MNQENPNEIDSFPNSSDENAAFQSATDTLIGVHSDYILLGNMEAANALTSSNLPIATVNEALDIHDLLSGHAPSEAAGGYLHFTNDSGVVTLAIDLCDRSGSGNSTYVPLATLQGVSGLSTSEIMNALLANHEISFG